MVAFLLIASVVSVTFVSPAAGVSKIERSEVAAVRLWIKAHEAVFTSLQTDIKAVAASIQNGSITKITSDCDQLAADVGTASLVPHIPDSEIQSRWSAALHDFGVAASDCTRGVIQNNSRLTAEYGPKVQAGIKQTDAVLDALDKLK
jgi:hypothetical protein